MKPKYTTEKTHRNVVTVRMNMRAGDEQWFLLRSDAHHDHPACDRKTEKRHLDEASDRGAGIIDAGDCLCAMQGKEDKRGTKSAIRQENNTSVYFDSLVDEGAEFYGPYAHNWLVLGQGNHETAVKKKHETCLTTRLVQAINTAHGSNVYVGGYSGWVRFLFNAYTRRSSKLLWYFHGTGGGGPVTRGVIQTNRMAIISPDADFILSGHTHDEWRMPIARVRLNEAGVPFRDEQIHLRSGGYKEAWGDGFEGFEVEKMLGPKPIGAWWLKFWCHAGQIMCDQMPAK